MTYTQLQKKCLHLGITLLAFGALTFSQSAQAVTTLSDSYTGNIFLSCGPFSNALDYSRTVSGSVSLEVADFPHPPQYYSSRAGVNGLNRSDFYGYNDLQDPYEVSMYIDQVQGTTNSDAGGRPVGCNADTFVGAVNAYARTATLGSGSFSQTFVSQEGAGVIGRDNPAWDAYGKSYYTGLTISSLSTTYGPNPIIVKTGRTVLEGPRYYAPATSSVGTFGAQNVVQKTLNPITFFINTYGSVDPYKTNSVNAIYGTPLHYKDVSSALNNYGSGVSTNIYSGFNQNSNVILNVAYLGASTSPQFSTSTSASSLGWLLPVDQGPYTPLPAQGDLERHVCVESNADANAVGIANAPTWGCSPGSSVVKSGLPMGNSYTRGVELSNPSYTGWYLDTYDFQSAPHAFVDPGAGDITDFLRGWASGVYTRATRVGHEKLGNDYVDPTTFSCDVSPNYSSATLDPNTGEVTVSWSVYVGGGVAPFTYYFNSTPGDAYGMGCDLNSGTCTLTYNQAGQVVMDLSVYDSSGAGLQPVRCTSGLLNIERPLALSCSASAPSALPNTPIGFNVNPSGGNGVYLYSWSGAFTSSLQSPTYTFTTPGIYTAVVNVTSGSETKACTVQIPVETGLSATCSANPNPAPTNSPVLFTAQPTGGTGSYTYIWDSGAGSASTYSKAFSTAGATSIPLTVISGTQTQGLSCPLNVQAGFTGSITSVSASNAVCSGASLTKPVISWTSTVSPITRFHIYRSNGVGPQTQVGDVMSTVTTYTDTSVDPVADVGKSFVYTVVPYDGGLNAEGVGLASSPTAPIPTCSAGTCTLGLTLPPTGTAGSAVSADIAISASPSQNVTYKLFCDGSTQSATGNSLPATIGSTCTYASAGTYSPKATGFLTGTPAVTCTDGTDSIVVNAPSGALSLTASPKNVNMYFLVGGATSNKTNVTIAPSPTTLGVPGVDLLICANADFVTNCNTIDGKAVTYVLTKNPLTSIDTISELRIKSALPISNGNYQLWVKATTQEATPRIATDSFILHVVNIDPNFKEL